MKNFVTLCTFLIISLSINAQFSSFNLPKHSYHEGIKRVTEFAYHYDNEFFQTDSTPIRIKEFNEKGQLIKEIFKSKRRGKGVTNPFYKYKYNDQGFLIDIDSSGMFGYGYSSTATDLPLSFETYITREKYMTVDSVRKLVDKIFYTERDSAKFKIVYSYNKTYQIETEFHFTAVMSDDYQLTSNVLYEYDQQNMLVKVIYRNEEDKIYTIKEFVYEYF